eukprot:TRINITY_DN2001_c0_g1_i1.p2 TRINITY_DN2001_c0_g1~~TRINITY_DN2001_c0_g1_i1.p2  ORF type:complete len:414 (+),score=167.26 TRINITY_DN2001_c0_g1_i1:51-1292(+)
MVVVTPFKGLVPPKDVVPNLCSPPYDVINSKEARVMAGDNEQTFLRVVKPEINLDENVHIYDDLVYETGKQMLNNFVENGFLVQQNTPCLFIYSQKMGEHVQYGIVAGASVEEYGNGTIKLHEQTRQAKEDDRTRMVKTQMANTGPVFLTYNANSKIDEIVDDIVSKPADRCFVNYLNVEHKLWIVEDQEIIDKLVDEFETVPASYVADGHHRARSAWRVGAELTEEKSKVDSSSFLAVFFPHNQLQIIDYNRIVKDLNGLSVDEFFEALEESFEVELVEDENKQPNHKYQFSMYIEKQWYHLTIKDEVLEELPPKDPSEALGSYRLTQLLLDPILDIGDLRKSDRIDFVGGIRGYEELEKRVDEDDFVVAFGVAPVTIEELMEVADAGCLMPPKSTWFEPKLASGLVVKKIE